ncbi:hypothetical protein KJZ61_04275 [Candidatus Dependentiae bacterium]|nr:hypothetical protein [Candidatus Dependentiae bacterium]
MKHLTQRLQLALLITLSLYSNSHTQSVEALYQEAQECKKSGKSIAAIDCYEKILQMDPEHIAAHFYLANECFALYRLEEASTHYRYLIHRYPQFTSALYNAALTSRYLGRMHEAQEYYATLLLNDPNNAHLHYGLAESLLTLGDFEQGFAEFEWRWKRDADTRNFAQQLWDGETSLEQKTILLRAEYGHGDTIQFIRYAQLLKNAGARVLVETPAPLVDLLSHCSYIDSVIPIGKPLPEFDAQLPIMSLAHAFKTTQKTIPNIIPYLEPDQQLMQEWHTKLANDHTFKIGICWDPSPYFDSFHSPLSKKAVPLSLFYQLSHIPGVSLYSLQRINGTDQLQHIPQDMVVHEFGDDFDKTHGRFMDTAAVIPLLDLIITVDTSVAHLAGALGAQVWVLLPYVADWRWMQNTDSTPWYPTMRLFRQETPQNWEHVMDKVSRALIDHLNKAINKTDTITADISVGELIDKITILELKQETIRDPQKLGNISQELYALQKTRGMHVSWTPRLLQLSAQLKKINRELWHIEDAIRAKEASKSFDEEFIQLARSVYIINDLRCRTKRQINDLSGSKLVEEKSYKDY